LIIIHVVSIHVCLFIYTAIMLTWCKG